MIAQAWKRRGCSRCWRSLSVCSCACRWRLLCTERASAQQSKARPRPAAISPFELGARRRPQWRCVRHFLFCRRWECFVSVPCQRCISGRIVRSGSWCVAPRHLQQRWELERPANNDLEKYWRGQLITREILKDRDLSVGVNLHRMDMEFDSW